MKRSVWFAIVTVLALTAGGAAAQEPARPSPEMMQMCRQMMGSMGPMHEGAMHGGMMPGGMMPGGMMGPMPMMGAGDPKQQAEALAMRGEMLRAMGEIMTKYAERMREPK
ncbi:MAG TPA: hypothetical protein VHT71_21125 [Methylomirabilota bacterium]|jgi:hypothetical protein|nr:hypothetical protein [Methylomirabilota bacterium]